MWLRKLGELFGACWADKICSTQARWTRRKCSNPTSHTAARTWRRAPRLDVRAPDLRRLCPRGRGAIIGQARAALHLNITGLPRNQWRQPNVRRPFRHHLRRNRCSRCVGVPRGLLIRWSGYLLLLQRRGHADANQVSHKVPQQYVVAGAALRRAHRSANLRRNGVHTRRNSLDDAVQHQLRKNRPARICTRLLLTLQEQVHRFPQRLLQRLRHVHLHLHRLLLLLLLDVAKELCCNVLRWPGGQVLGWLDRHLLRRLHDDGGPRRGRGRARRRLRLDLRGLGDLLAAAAELLRWLRGCRRPGFREDRQLRRRAVPGAPQTHRAQLHATGPQLGRDRGDLSQGLVALRCLVAQDHDR
mmetsp:Transcript_44404/g.127213  ORF Transcript_44404/g.127213 Transcript_44404/m.127213 type:complete len:357 (+) Transcript_44404:215-1285(+)